MLKNALRKDAKIFRIKNLLIDIPNKLRYDNYDKLP